MNKIIVIGCPGSGKSTFSKQLHRKTGLPLYHLDMLFWNSDKTHVSKELFNQRLSDVLAQDSWIIDGNYSNTLEMRLKACNTVFLLDMSVSTCLSGASARIGKPRNDMPWIEHELDQEFKNWIIDFPTKELPHIYSLLKKYDNKDVIVFKSHEQIADYLSKL